MTLADDKTYGMGHKGTRPVCTELTDHIQTDQAFEKNALASHMCVADRRLLN